MSTHALQAMNAAGVEYEKSRGKKLRHCFQYYDHVYVINMICSCLRLIEFPHSSSGSRCMNLI